MAEVLSKIEFAKFFSRNFILPAMGMIFVFVLALYGWKGNELLYPGGLFGELSGVFSLQDLAKLWLAGKVNNVRE